MMRAVTAIFAKAGAGLFAFALLVAGSAANGQAAGPATVEYTIQAGETLSELGTRYFRRSSDYLRVQQFNSIARDRRIPVGRVILIPLEVLRSEPAEARVAGFRGSVRIAWRGSEGAASVGQPVGEGAEIVTGLNAFVRIRLPDGGHVSLPSNSRVRIERLRTVLLTGATDQNFRLATGRVETRAAPVRPGGVFEVTTPVAVAAVRGTEFRSAYFPGTESAATGVVEGAVAVRASQGETIAEAGQGVVVSEEGIRLLPLLPLTELSDAQLVQVGEAVVFRPAPIPGAAFYRARLATDAGMIDAFSEQDSDPEGTILFADVPDGQYFVQVTGVSQEGLEGRAGSYAFLRSRTGIGGLAAGATGAGGGVAYLFRWEGEGEGPNEFRFQLRSEDADAPPVFDLAGLTEARVSLTALAPGTYSWRVRTTRYVSGRRLDVWSEPQQLRIGG